MISSSSYSTQLRDGKTCITFSKACEITLGSGRHTLCPRAGMVIAPDGLETLKEKVIGCAIEVHRVLGPGLMESVYRDCLSIELRGANLRVDTERRVSLDYKGHRITNGLKMDLVVDDCLVVEVKAVDRLHPIFHAQLITYLKLADLPAGLLMNFNGTTLCAGLKRVVHPELYVRRVDGGAAASSAGVSRCEK